MPKRVVTAAPPDVQAVLDRDPGVQQAFQAYKAFLTAHGATSANDLKGWESGGPLHDEYFRLQDNLNNAQYTATKNLPGGTSYGLRDTSGRASKLETKLGWTDYVLPAVPGVAGLVSAGLSPAAQAAQGGTSATSAAPAAATGSNLSSLGTTAATTLPTTAAGATAAGAQLPTVFTSVDQAIQAGVAPTVAALTAAGVSTADIATAVDNGTVQDPTPQLGGTGGPAASTASNPLDKLFGGLTTKDYLGLGLGGLGLYLQSRQVSKAVDAQQQATAAALAQSKAIYEQQRADQAPWRNAGAGAVNTLAYLMGVTPTTDQAPVPSMQVPANPTAPGQTPNPAVSGMPQMEQNKIAPQNLGSVGNTVLMQAPTGETQAIPLGMVAQYEQRGAKRVS